MLSSPFQARSLVTVSHFSRENWDWMVPKCLGRKKVTVTEEKHSKTTGDEASDA